jgi:HTH-type transcriptional regulator / antitoxin HipB
MLSIQEIGSQVRHLRRERGLTQADLAALAGVGRRFVSELENGKPTLRLAETHQVLRVFGLTLATRPLEAQERE